MYSTDSGVSSYSSHSPDSAFVELVRDKMCLIKELNVSSGDGLDTTEIGDVTEDVEACIFEKLESDRHLQRPSHFFQEVSNPRFGGSDTEHVIENVN